jgi:hypothetical protein
MPLLPLVFVVPLVPCGVLRASIYVLICLSTLYIYLSTYLPIQVPIYPLVPVVLLVPLVPLMLLVPLVPLVSFLP